MAMAARQGRGAFKNLAIKKGEDYARAVMMLLHRHHPTLVTDLKMEGERHTIHGHEEAFWRAFGRTWQAVLEDWKGGDNALPD
jgi:hypothetical protein